MSKDISQLASKKYNSMPHEDRKKAGLGYALAQLTTIKQIRQKNKEAYQAQDRKLAEWQKNVEKHLGEEL